MAHIGDAGDLTTALQTGADPILELGETIAERMIGGYAEIAYNLLPLFLSDTEASLSPYYRFESYDTQHRVPSGFSRDTTKEIRNHTIGLQYRPISNVVLKADVRLRDAEGGEIADEFNLGVGFAF